MRRWFLFLLLVAAGPCAGGVTGLLRAATSPDSGRGLELFPPQRVFPPFTADALEHRLSLSRLLDNRDWIAAIGGAVPLVQVNGHGYALQAGAEVTTFHTLVKTPGHLSILTVDYRVDFPVTLRMGSLAFRSGYGHISCHLADDGIEIMQRSSFQYIRDYIRLAVARDIPWIGGFLYAGADYAYHIVPERDRHWQIEAGGEAGNFVSDGIVRPYLAVDLKLKQQVGWGSTQSYQIGARFVMGRLLPVRLSYTYRTGFDERGQFFTVKESVSLLGLSMDL